MSNPKVEESVQVVNAIAKDLSLALHPHMAVIDQGGLPSVERAMLLIASLRAYANVIESTAVPVEARGQVATLTEFTTKTLGAKLEEAQRG